MGRFADVGNAKVFAKGAYFPCLSARYRVRVLKCKAQKPRQGAGLAFIVECEVLQVLSVAGLSGQELATAPAAALTDADGRTVPAIGEERSWYVDLGKDAGPPDMRGFVALVTGEPLAEMTPDAVDKLCESVVGDDQPIAGLQLLLQTHNRPTRKGSPFTIHDWRIAPAAAPTAAPTAAALPTCRACDERPVMARTAKLCRECFTSEVPF